MHEFFWQVQARGRGRERLTGFLSDLGASD
jgi:hypothetical protein